MTELVKCASTTVMHASEWGIENWMDRVIREDLAATLYGVKTCTQYKSDLNDELRTALWRELSFKSHSELLASKALAVLANIAPSTTDFQYLLTHAVDEARHAENFAQHFYSVYGEKNESLITSLNEHLIDTILQPLQNFFDDYVVKEKNYYCGVAIIAIVLEGVLAPSSELSELKWQPFDGRAAEVQRSANIDEIRHLCVCAEIMKEGISKSENVRSDVITCIKNGLALWGNLPVYDMLYERESHYQRGMAEKAALIEDYQLADGYMLIDTDQNQRIQLASQWSHLMQYERLEYLGIRDDIEND